MHLINVHHCKMWKFHKKVEMSEQNAFCKCSSLEEITFPPLIKIYFDMVVVDKHDRFSCLVDKWGDDPDNTKVTFNCCCFMSLVGWINSW